VRTWDRENVRSEGEGVRRESIGVGVSGYRY
jgi:hypothetical protein